MKKLINKRGYITNYNDLFIDIYTRQEVKPLSETIIFQGKKAD